MTAIRRAPAVGTDLSFELDGERGKSPPPKLGRKGFFASLAARLPGIVAATTILVTSAPALATIAYVQGVYSDPFSAVTSTTLTFSNAQIAGDLNVVAIAWADMTSHVTSVTDSKGNIYTAAGSPRSGSSITQTLYYAKAIASAAPGANTLTVTFSTLVQRVDVRAAEYSGLDSSTPLDQTAGATGSSANPSAGPVTTTSANEVIVAATYAFGAVTGPGTGYTQRILTSPRANALEDRVVTATGAYSASAQLAASTGWALSLASFRATGDTQAPTAPTGLTANSAGSSSVHLSWTASTDNVGVTGYFVERCQGSGCSTFTQIGAPTGTSFTDSGLSPATSYSYRVRATDAAGNLSAYSNTATTTTTAALTAPSGLIVVAAASSEIDLAWSGSTGGSGTISYLLERCSGVSCSSFAQIAAPSGTAYNDTGRAPTTSYSYRVRATDSQGDLGPYSNVVSYTTPAATADCSK